jgi:hypothetical protein
VQRIELPFLGDGGQATATCGSRTARASILRAPALGAKLPPSSGLGGGPVVDVEARATIERLLAAMRQHGLMDS